MALNVSLEILLFISQKIFFLRRKLKRWGKVNQTKTNEFLLQSCWTVVKAHHFCCPASWWAVHPSQNHVRISMTCLVQAWNCNVEQNVAGTLWRKCNFKLIFNRNLYNRNDQHLIIKICERHQDLESLASNKRGNVLSSLISSKVNLDLSGLMKRWASAVGGKMAFSPLEIG